MSILIKGVEMPRSCFGCPFMYARRFCSCNPEIEFTDDEYSELNGRYDGCPLVEVPTPHGRLIDADALNTDNMMDVYIGGDLYRHEWSVDEWINSAPTIIPEEEG